MKKVLAVLAITTAFASPVLAQSYDPDVGSGNVTPSAWTDNYSSGFNAMAQAPRTHRQQATKGSDAVVDEAGNVEQDPDPAIRSQLERENNEGF